MSLPGSAINPHFVGSPERERGSSSRRRSRRHRHRGPVGRLLGRMSVERRDVLVIAAVLLTAAMLLRFTTVFDGWFDRFSGPRPDQQQQVEELAVQR